MKTKKLFHYQMEELPSVAEFTVSIASRDMTDLHDYSPVFTMEYLDGIKEKIAACVMRMRSWTVIQELKATTTLLVEITDSLRVRLNKLEGYVKLAGSATDVPLASFGITGVRHAIKIGNTEGVLDGIRVMLAPVERNIEALMAVGLKQELIDEFNNMEITIDQLNTKQIELESERNRLTEDNIVMFNDLWLSIQPILEAGKAIYRGVSDAKLKDYTMAQIIKRIHHVGKHESESAKQSGDATV